MRKSHEADDRRNLGYTVCMTDDAGSTGAVSGQGPGGTQAAKCQRCHWMGGVEVIGIRTRYRSHGSWHTP